MNRFSKHFQTTFEQIRDPLLIVDLTGNIRGANPSAQAVLDLGQNDHLRDVVSLERSFVFDVELLLSLISQDTPVVGHRLKDSEGNEADVVVDVLDMPGKKGRSQTKLIHIKDFSPFQNYERWKDELISMVAHEIKNPLSAMKNSMGILISQANDGMSDGQINLLKVSTRSIDRLTRLLDNFLDVSRLSSGQYVPDPDWEDARGFTSEVISTFKTLFNVRRQRLNFSVSGALGKIYVDGPKLEQILINLLNNAIKFTQDDGEISVSLEPASLEALSDDLRILPWSELADLKFVRVTVKDTGIGMTEKTIAHLFTRHYGQDERTVSKGSHLGLSISKALVEVQNGSLEFESQLGVGTEVSVTLPADEITFTILNRVKSIDRVLSRMTSLRREPTFLAVRKDTPREWENLLVGKTSAPVVNPTFQQEQNGDVFMWTLGERLAVSLIAESADQTANDGDSRRVENKTVPHDGYAVVGQRLSSGDSRVNRIMGIALTHLKQDKELTRAI